MDHLQIMVGTAKSYPFADSWADRIYNGAVVFALGEVEDGTYSDITADERSRACAASNNAPTESPKLSFETDSTVSASEGESTATQATGLLFSTSATIATVDEEDGGNEDEQGQGDEISISSDARLEDTCPSASSEAISSSKQVVVEYKYSMITSSDESVTDMENTMHSELIDSKCNEARRANKFRRLQESIVYYGFDSNPPDEVVAGEECTGVTLASGEKCSVVQGGFTAYVPMSVDDSAVQDDLGSFADNILSENGAVVESDADSSRGDVGAAIEEEQAQDNSNAQNTQPLSTVAIIVLAAVAGCVVLALILIFIKGRNKRVKRANANEELFHEFDEDPTDLNSGWGQNNSRSVDAPLFPRVDEESTIGGIAPVILNEHDEMSLVSNDLSKSKFAILPPTTPGSDAGSRSSSKGSVKFVRAGESFTSRSHQPEDTVDL
jgi:hypothetical protein